MRIAIIGAGPSGLYLAYLLKRAKFPADIEVIEQNPRDATFGFGLGFSESALEFLDAEDPETHSAITPAMEFWNDSNLYLKGQEVRIDGMRYAGIGRLALLRILQARAQSVGIVPTYQKAIANPADLGDAALIDEKGEGTVARGDSDRRYRQGDHQLEQREAAACARGHWPATSGSGRYRRDRSSDWPSPDVTETRRS